jgi:uncharacterized protein
MSENIIYKEIFKQIEKQPVIDTHEHLLWDESYRVNGEDDVLSEYLSHYLSSDVVSSGLKPVDLEKVRDKKRDIYERWKIVEPYWEASRFTGYGRALDISVKAIYDIDGINGATIRDLNDAFMKSKRPGHYNHVLKELCGIQVSLLDIWTFRLDGDNPLFKRVWQPLNFIIPASSAEGEVISNIEKNYSIRVNNLDHWMEACRKELDYMLATYGVKILKCSIAYSRSLRFEKVEYSVAKDSFNTALAKWEREGRLQGKSLELPIEVQDFMMHYILELANERNLTFQFHTGIQEGNGNILTNSDPSLMINLFTEYPDVDFDLFHISYPYQNVACALGKMFPNVFIDMCWAHIISPSASIRALDDFLDAIPYNKISAFGGDYLFVDGVYGHLYMARQNVSRVLAEKVKQGIFSLDKAVDIGKALFYDNPMRIFKL